MKRKIFSVDQIEMVINCCREKKIVLTGGCFDIFHFGHLSFLTQSKKRGDVLMILLESDQFILKKKHRPPVHSQRQRATILSYLCFVDFIILLKGILKDNDYLNLVKKIRPWVIATTKNDPQLENKKKQADLVGAKVVQVTPLLKNFSSTIILKKIINKIGI